MNSRSLLAPRPLLGLLAVLALLAGPGAQAQALRAPGRAGGLALPAAPAATTAQSQADYIVAVVNTEPITNQELRARVARVQRQLAQQGGTQPGREALARQVLEQLIVEKAQLQLARETGLRVDDAALDEAEQSVAVQNQIDRAELRRRLAQDGVPLAQFREELRNQLLLARLREREVDARVRIGEPELDQFIRSQASDAPAAAVELNLAMLLVAVPENGTPAQVEALRQRAQGLADRARAGADFGALVREFSDAKDRAPEGGQMGLRSVDRYPTLFVEATQALRPGEIAGPVRSGAGFHVLKLIEKRQASQPSMTVAQTRARHILLRPSASLGESAARARLADYKRRIEARQADFAALAREHSQDGSAREGGELGWASPGQFVPEFEEAMDKLAPGQISEPLVSRFGVHLIQVLERRQSSLGPREQRELARRMLREKKLDEAYVNWVQELRARAYVEFREQPAP
ncbi:peptidylprolyl isomerase [Ramlibacter sp. 2FC]|uniref:peptidylprolyl isomerase n=1 Tax=Ramlibacter sp. 2FC TaxID=2502188 RepID=UPI0010F5DEED|nr:peptidylprolyl isomerase [Ramlibacter sp. 2FC]